ncbi:hypothetical protein YPPY98_2272, partial [Yersinia pestis PY-98]
MTVSLHDLYL